MTARCITTCEGRLRMIRRSEEGEAGSGWGKSWPLLLPTFGSLLPAGEGEAV